MADFMVVFEFDKPQYWPFWPFRFPTLFLSKWFKLKIYQTEGRSGIYASQPLEIQGYTSNDNTDITTTVTFDGNTRLKKRTFKR